MISSSTPDILEALANEENKGFTFIDEDGKEQFFSFAEIYRKSLDRAVALKNHNIKKGDKIGIIIPDAEDFIFNFYGAIMAGIIPVPIYPPTRPDRINYYMESVKHIIKTSHSQMVITTPFLNKILLFEEKMITSKELTNDKGEFEKPCLQGDDVAFIQFTSGSTAYPKGVMVTHNNIASNVDCIMGEGVNVTNEDIGVSWLPLHHDMGLIGCAIAATYHKLPMTFMPPILFVKRPTEWLRAITRYKATISFAPNFAYALCTARIRDLNGLDLSSWRIAGCAAEPISHTTLNDFSKKFGCVGFKESSFCPAYGMAESTLAVTFSKPGDGIIYDTVNPSSLYEEGKAVSTAEKGSVIVSCGKIFSKHELLIKDEKGNILPDRYVGEIMIKGPSIMKGYYNNEEATQETIKNGWLHTGDLGYLVNGNLYVCGRKKDLIIIGGRNYYPQDIEWATHKVNGIRRGNVVAFGLTGDKMNESVVVVAESREKKNQWKEICNNIKKAVIEAIGIRIDCVEIVPRGTLPKTTSGKLQRNKTKELFKAGKLKRNVFLSNWRNYGKTMVRFLRK